ncbi:MAG: low molecular weight protein-tyrosine-phosphatase [Bacteroidota bacterium]
MSKKILMVCLGNICRSPLAEGILKSKVDDDIIVDSAGIDDYHSGELPDNRSMAIAKKNNIDISSQRARKIVAADFDKYDHIYAMDETNYNNLKTMAKTQEQRNKIFMIMNELHPGENIDVPDPYWGGEHGFSHVYAMLDEATDKILEKL